MYNQQQQQADYAPNYYGGRGGAQWGRGAYNRAPQPELEAPRRGGRGRGGRPRPAQPPAQVPEPPVQPAEVPLPPLPQPKHLSKTSSPLTNDPLYLESFMGEPGTEMRMAPLFNEIHPGHYGFAQVVEEDYKSFAARSHVYAKNVSESMHSYYNAMQLYSRMLEVHRKNGHLLTNDEADFVSQMHHEPYPVSKTMEHYLAGFGDTTIPGSVECQFHFYKPELVQGENIVGFFGAIQDNAVDYATYVCPGVVAQRIVEDVARSEAAVGVDPGEQWQLEVEIGEGDEAPPPPQPNRKYIGWAPRQRLRQEMITALRNCRIGANEFHHDNPSIPFNTRLMNYIYYQMTEMRGFVEGKVPEGRAGSIAQLITNVLNDQDQASAQAPFSITGSIVYSATAFRYRVDMTADPNGYAPFDGAPVIQNLERNRMAENPMLNQYLYQTRYTAQIVR